MRLFYLLMTAMALASYSYASDLLAPENCAEFLQRVVGDLDRPAEAYSLTLKNGKDLFHGGWRIPTYYLRADGIPNGKKFQIANRNAMGKVTVVFEGTHLGDGKIIRKEGSVDTCEPIVCGGFERGEPSQFLLLDPKDKTTNAIFYLPYPVEPAIMNQFKVTMHYVCNDPEAYLFDMENLTPGERVYITSTSDSDSMNSTFIASTSGRATSFVAWVGTESPNGQGSFEVKRASGTLAINFPWRREPSHLPSPLVIFTIGHAPTAEEIQSATEVYRATP
jgi:hypothetical protein